MAQKVLMMKLKVDLDCPKCYKKVKKALHKFPQITDELFDEKSNTVIIKVVCYNPEKLMNKLCYKADGSIKSIVILEPPKPPQVQAQPLQKPKEPEKIPAPAPAPAPVLLVPTSQPVPMWQPYHCGPYYEAQQFECYGRPIYDSWGGGRQCCHEVANQQSCSIM
ncbi:hypothetical protein EUTSA_v10011834mg [Eutrema salsugineum]|uniref:HMA domain-containing protein n=1 Tax=Eutrema salsugineum TaxID=72664 RepID=V4KGP4_EUTSA|nr:protein PYRICULARIA ORYZAE RESISTANCE 21 isoform X1 [Eutrema salsugineum]ESQ30369.1 hypothetical protein EUTSA_v10011834mg [Eutrema salsugineum]